jgi:hypothetical protein
VRHHEEISVTDTTDQHDGYDWQAARGYIERITRWWCQDCGIWGAVGCLAFSGQRN